MDLPASLQWVEVDLPGMIDYKTSILADEKPHCQLKRVRLDLADVAARRDLFSSLGARAKKVTVICEGLLVYFTEKEVASLARDLAVQPGFNYWVIDIASPGLIRMMNKHMRDALHSAGAPLKFGPEEGPAFFLPHGWKPASIRQMLKSAAKINRLSFFFRLLAALPSSDGPQGNRPWSAVVLYKRTM
jgi:O-methyltransferase involved in polyketide biosynthesis